MAEIEKVPAVSVVATTTSSVAVTTTILPTSQETFDNTFCIGGGGSVKEVALEGNRTFCDLGTSPTQEKSINSHPHDSEYDTASDLEGNEEYDDDDMDDSLTEDDDDDSEDETETDDGGEDDDEGVDVDLQGQEKIDAEAQKKVDEDRSNPQYIPKRGTFYEHDDRTAEVEGEGVRGDGQEAGESPVLTIGGSSSVSGSKTLTTPTTPTASKTIKKWQPASAVDRWSHDRFDPSEQAPKSRAELVNAYGYDIRTEDAPPKARRRRRYGRGPSKYNRNWEDESAYLKTNNKERKPPKPSDFPALNEKSSKGRRSRRTREEKENRLERRKRESKTGEGRSERSDKMGQSSRNNNHADDHDRRSEQRNDRGDRNNEGGYKHQNRQKSFNNRGQGQGQSQTSVGRQVAMEFKQKNRQNYQNLTSGCVNINSSSLSSRLEAQRQPQQNQQQQQTQNMTRKSNGGSSKDHSQSVGYQNQQPNQQYDGFNNNKNKHLEQGYQPMQTAQQHSSLTQQQHVHQQTQQSSMLNHSISRQNPQIPNKTQQPSSNLSQRLQQVQNRNDPSHVGSVQMHALATQNQQQQLMQQQQATNVMVAGPPSQQQQPQNQNINQPSMEQRGPPKRYSSLRRSQHDAQHLSDHQQQQQLQQQMHIQQQQQQQQNPPPAMMMPTDQAMLQANLMQMYHQENLQAQMQALQVTQPPAVAKAPNYAGQGSQAPPQQPYPGTAPAPAAYYVASPDAYTAAATAAVTAQATQAAASYAAQQANPNYLAQQQTAAAAAAAAANLVYNNPNNAGQQAVATATAYGPSPQVSVVTQPQASSTAPAGYQNYNTVGGTTYFVPPPTQTSTRPVSLPQRRPTNAIPILPPSEKNKQKSQQDSKTESDTKAPSQSNSNHPPIGSAENIDHIIDNMFVQRPAFQPPSTTTVTNISTSNTSPKITTPNDGATAASENLNTVNSPSQDNNALTMENVNKVSSDTTANTTAASSATTNTIATTTTTCTENSNNNQISAQE